MTMMRNHVPPPPGEENVNFSLTAPRRVVQQFDLLCRKRNWSRSFGMRYMMEQEVNRSQKQLQGLRVQGANPNASHAAVEAVTPTSGG
jgi:hypothetical protein